MLFLNSCEIQATVICDMLLSWCEIQVTVICDMSLSWCEIQATVICDISLSWCEKNNPKAKKLHDLLNMYNLKTCKLHVTQMLWDSKI